MPTTASHRARRAAVSPALSGGRTTSARCPAVIRAATLSATAASFSFGGRQVLERDEQDPRPGRPDKIVGRRRDLALPARRVHADVPGPEGQGDERSVSLGHPLRGPLPIGRRRSERECRVGRHLHPVPGDADRREKLGRCGIPDGDALRQLADLPGQLLAGQRIERADPDADDQRRGLVKGREQDGRRVRRNSPSPVRQEGVRVDSPIVVEKTAPPDDDDVAVLDRVREPFDVRPRHGGDSVSGYRDGRIPRQDGGPDPGIAAPESREKRRQNRLVTGIPESVVPGKDDTVRSGSHVRSIVPRQMRRPARRTEKRSRALARPALG